MAVLSIKLEEETDLLAWKRGCCSAAITIAIITTIKILISGQVARWIHTIFIAMIIFILSFQGWLSLAYFCKEMYACQATGTSLLGDKADMLVLVYTAWNGFSQGLKKKKNHV